MNQKINIKKISISLLLLFALTIPSLITFAHQLSEEHTHEVCNEQQTHMHESQVHCDVCEYHFSNFYYNVSGTSEIVILPLISENIFETFTTLCYYLPLTNKQLRAPPAFSLV